MKLFLGVDGGQSGTTALIGDETGRILGQGTAGPCNHAAAGEGRAKLERSVRESLAEACRQAGLDAGAVRFAVACFGMSGGPEDKRAILAAILHADQLVVTTDAVTALSGATATGQGIVTIAGTGSIAFGRNAAGREARAGGWGYVFGDEGGAFDIVRQAARAVLRAEEGWGPPTSLLGTLLESTGAASANEMLHRLYGDEWGRPRVASLAPLVDRAAAEGDAVAQRIVDSAAIQLAMLAGAVRGQLWQPGEPVDVAYVGGVFRSDRLREKFRLLMEMEPGVRCVAPLYGPDRGALLEAYRVAGVENASDPFSAQWPAPGS
ncbi:MAG TPA: BadF/BadG/BcrA/BcrD ATPase family protein [Bryobacteraceae bacterium]|nr:BadF/BadG/BcrA/BcrD ATPase family protein [Bryobacteraceae bacterium]